MSSVPIGYIEVLSNVDITLSTRNSSKNWDGIIEYAICTEELGAEGEGYWIDNDEYNDEDDDEAWVHEDTWRVWDGSDIHCGDYNHVTGMYTIKLRGIGNTTLTGLTSSTILNDRYKIGFKVRHDDTSAQTTVNADFWINGNLENLRNYTTAEDPIESNGHPKMADYCYSYLFANTLLRNDDSRFEMTLPSTELSKYCYQHTFEGTELTKSLKLPAMKLEWGCYQGIYQYCGSITTASELPALDMINECYQYMYSGCTSLTRAPELPSVNLASYCYADMFAGCTSLTKAPRRLPALTLKVACYASMFHNCRSLIEAPDLPAKTLVSNCYSGIFYNCKSLTTIRVGFTDWSEMSGTSWVYGVPSGGVFQCSNGLPEEYGNNRIPTGWMVTRDLMPTYINYQNIRLMDTTTWKVKNTSNVGADSWKYIVAPTFTIYAKASGSGAWGSQVAHCYAEYYSNGSWVSVYAHKKEVSGSGKSVTYEFNHMYSGGSTGDVPNALLWRCRWRSAGDGSGSAHCYVGGIGMWSLDQYNTYAKSKPIRGCRVGIYNTLAEALAACPDQFIGYSINGNPGLSLTP